MPKVSYLVTCCNETDTLERLLETIGTVIKNNTDDECVVLIDSEAINNQSTKDILSKFAVAMAQEIIETKQCLIVEHPLSRDYGSHKNFGIQRCNGNFIFQLDGDEMPPESLLGENLHALIDSNPSIEAYAVPRINDFKGITNAHAMQWGWKLTPSTSIIHEKAIDTLSTEYKFLKENGYILEESVI